MILFWGALAVSFVLAFAFWAQGQWTPAGRDPYKIGSLVSSLVWLGISGALAYAAWWDLGVVIAKMEAGDSDLSAYVEKARSARNSLSTWSALSILAVLAAVKAASDTANAFKHRKARTKAKPQETHA